MARFLPFLAFVAVAVLLLGGMHYYVWARLVRDPHLPAATARLLTSLLATMALVLPATLVLSRTRGAPRPMVWIAFLWMGVVFLLSAFLGFADAGRALAWVARKLASPDTPADPERRVLLARALAVGVGGVVLERAQRGSVGGRPRSREELLAALEGRRDLGPPRRDACRRRLVPVRTAEPARRVLRRGEGRVERQRHFPG